MSGKNILYVCQEISPYMPQSDMADMCRTLLRAMQERGNEIRTFMPRYGCINERRNQLHEVIRLSGMNLIIDDNDHQLIIKVASIPAARVQIYFIDNDDYFGRKAMFADDQGRFFADNDERAIFFARGVLETVRKLRWQPDIVHCHGWFTSVVPLYLRHAFADDPLFSGVKIVSTLYGDSFDGTLDPEVAGKLVQEGVPPHALSVIAQPTAANLARLSIDHSDGVVVETADPGPGVLDHLRQSGKPALPYTDRSADAYLDQYQKLYNEIVK